MLIANDLSIDDTQPGTMDPRDRAYEYARTLCAGSRITQADVDGLEDACAFLPGALRTRGLYLIYRADDQQWVVRRGL